MFIVRYADDLKVFTNHYKSAQNIFHAIKNYLGNHLGLNISNEKSKIINLRKRKSDFLGFTIQAVKKGKKRIARTHVMEKKKRKIIKQGRILIRKIRKNPGSETVNTYNSYIVGVRNYYQTATYVNKDFQEIAYRLMKTRLKGACTVWDK